MVFISKILRIGLVGFGNIGAFHAENLFEQKIDSAQLGAVCDIEPERLEVSKKKFPNVPVFLNAAEMLSECDLDAVIIATPHYSHPEIAVGSFEAGLHVLCEKPAAVTARKVAEMAAASEKAGKVFCVMHNQRTDPIFMEMRRLLKSGALGKLTRFSWIVTNWFRTEKYYKSSSWRATWAGEGGGVMLNQAYHNIDLWQWLLGMPQNVTSFFGFGKAHNIEVEDEATIFADYGPGGLTGVFVTSTGEFPGVNRLEIVGEMGRLTAENGKLVFTELAESSHKVINGSGKNFAEIEAKMIDMTKSGKGGHEIILKNFVKAILSGEELISPGAGGQAAVQLLNAIYLSAFTGKKIELPADANEFEKELKIRASASGLKKNRTDVSHNSDSSRWQVKW